MVMDGEVRSIVIAGVILIAYLFGLFVLYLVLTNPFDWTIMALENASNHSMVSYEVSLVGGVYDIMFGLAAFIPIAWFVAWVFHREPDWRYYR